MNNPNGAACASTEEIEAMHREPPPFLRKRTHPTGAMPSINAAITELEQIRESISTLQLRIDCVLGTLRGGE